MYDSDEDEECILSEEDHSKLMHIERILLSKGTNLAAFEKDKCPYCKSNCIAAIAYHVYDNEDKKVADDVHTETDAEDPIVCERWYEYRLGAKNNIVYPELYCMQCGTEFGKFVFGGHR